MRFVLILGGLLGFGSSIASQEEPTSDFLFQPSDGDTVVFVGDSITHQSLYTQYLENFFHTRYPDRRVSFHNAGVAGDSVSDVLTRFETDVASHSPTFVTILLGMNDGKYEAFSDETGKAYREGMRELFQRIDECGATPIALSPTMFDHHQRELRKNDETYRFREKAFDPDYNSLLSYFSAWLRQESARNQTPFVDLWTPLNELTFSQRRVEPDFTLVEDAIHPGAAGHFVMAHTILMSLGQERPFVSEIEIMGDGAGWRAHSRGEVTQLEISKNGDKMGFTFRALSLPWRVPETMSQKKLRWGPSAPASLGYRLTNAAQNLNRETLRVETLAEGTYELRIDNVLIDRFTHRELAQGVELASYLQSPQNKQSLEVALLNRDRNDDVVRPLREIWSRVKGARRQEDMKKRLAALNLIEQAKSFQETAREMEDDLRAIAQPIARRYTLKLIEPNR